MNEAEYIDDIDACFPYKDEKKWKGAIDQGIEISDNAAYMALYEICAAPPEIPQSEVYRMLEYWSSHYDHPTKTVIMKAAIAVITGASLSQEEALMYLDRIARHPGLDGAAMILYHAAPSDNETFKKKYHEVGRMWGRKAGGRGQP